MRSIGDKGDLKKKKKKKSIQAICGYWPCAGGLTAVNAIGTHLRDPTSTGLTRWRMAVL